MPAHSLPLPIDQRGQRNARKTEIGLEGDPLVQREPLVLREQRRLRMRSLARSAGTLRPTAVFVSTSGTERCWP
jgi:hypothetical protein